MAHAPLLTRDALIALLDVLGANVFAKDLHGRYTFVNAAMARMLGAPREQVLMRRTQDFVSREVFEVVQAHDHQVITQGIAWEGEEPYRSEAGGELRTLWTVKSPLRDPAGTIVGLCGVSTDISDRKAVEARMQEQRELLHVVLNSIDAYVYMKDANRRYRYVNERVARNLGVRAEDVVGRLDSEVLPGDWADQFWALDQQVFATGERMAGEESHVTPDGRTHVHWSIKVPVRYEGVPTLIGFSTDISEVVQLREQLRIQAVTDALTGLANRGQFNDLTTKELARARRHQHPTSMLMLDVDLFKRVNDGFGHPAGDAVLKRVGLLLRQQVRLEDTVARVGGEEFAVLLPRTDRAAALILAERLRERIAADDDMLPGGQRITVSLGLAWCPDGRLSLEQLYAMADEQLYRAKQGGRNQVCAAD